MDKGLDENADQRFDKNADSNLAENTNEHLGRNSDKSPDRNAGKSLAKSAGENLSGDRGDSSGKDSSGIPVTRRRFLGLGVGSVAGVVALGYVGLAFDFLNPPPANADPLQEVGQTGDFKVNEPRLVTYKGNGIEQGVYVINFGAEGWLALDFHCTHLQCAVNWVGSVNKFMCPCHGGVYDIRGHVLSGPPPRPLYHRVLKIQGNSVMVGGRQA